MKTSAPPTSFRNPAINAVAGRVRRRRFLNVLTVLHAIGIGALWYAIWEISEQHWLGSVVTFVPRLPWLGAGAVLLASSLLLRSRTAWINLAALLFGAITIGGFNVPMNSLLPSESADASENDESRIVRIVSANVQNFSPDFRLLMREILLAHPDVIAFQEAFQPPRLLSEQFPDWHAVHVRGFWVGSKWPLKLLGQCDSDVYQRETAIAVEVSAPFGNFVLSDLHLMTARKSLRKLRPQALLTGDGPQAVTTALLERTEEAHQTRAFIHNAARQLPTLVCGDFNMPTSSSIYRSTFEDFTNCFEVAAWGCGYTAPCRQISLWPRNTPWQRIDHIIADSHWRVLECHVGEHDGSDHRLIAATLLLRPIVPTAERQSISESGMPDLSAEVDNLR